MKLRGGVGNDLPQLVINCQLDPEVSVLLHTTILLSVARRSTRDGSVVSRVVHIKVIAVYA